MELSSNKVSSSNPLDDHWAKTKLEAQTLQLPKSSSLKRPQNQLSDQRLNCPRCDSTNTKFCYYNNYNKSQPRHFCKACKRHWTNGGTLRNVPIGGGRKNKRLKTSTTVITTSSATTTTQIDVGNFSEEFYQTLNGRCSNLSLDFPLHQNQALQTPYSDSSSGFDSNPSFQFFNLGNQSGNELTFTSFLPPMNNNSISQPWLRPVVTSSCVDNTTGDWNWDDIDTFVTNTDLNITWDDDSEIKP